MAQLAEIANVTGYGRGPGLTAAAGVRAATLGNMNIVATMQGANVLAEHLYVMGAMFQPVSMILTGYFGNLMAEYAKALHYKNIDTRETYDSIKAGAVTPLSPGAAIQVYVGTEQAKFLEFGFVHHITGNWIQNPFMMPAADAVAPMLADALEQFAQFVGSRRWFSGAAAHSGAAEQMDGVRGLLYSYSKFAGDIQILGFSGLSASRGAALRGAKALGDTQSIMRGAISARASRRVIGRYVGSGLRAGGVATVAGTSSSWTGSSGRIYNRISGHAFGGSLSGIGL